jgi:hypothetical protein
MTKVLSFLDLKQNELQELSDEQAKTIIALSIGQEDLKQPLPADKLEDCLTKAGTIQMPFGMTVLVKRLQQTDAEYSPDAVLFVTTLCRTPGDAVMWAYTLFQQAKKSGKNSVTLHDLCMGPFGYGFPTDAGKERIWDAQKDKDSPLGNLLDNSKTWANEPNEEKTDA